MSAQILAFILALFGGGDASDTEPVLVAQAPASKPVASSKPAPAAAPSAGAAADANKIVDAVQKFYQDTPQLTATFRQTVVTGAFGKTTVSDGHVYLKKPGKMRWDYVSKRNKNDITRSQMSDGNNIWVVLVKDKQYFQQSLKNSTLPVAVTFLTGKGNLRNEFNAALDTSGKFGGKGDHVLHLTPKKPSAQFKDLYLVVDSKDYRVKTSVVVNAGGDVNQFQFFDPDLKKQVADTWFVFNPKTPAAKGFRQIQPPKDPAAAPAGKSP
jgi:outer membrane lipoprotein carrier protein